MKDERDPLSPAEDAWLDRMLDAAAPVEPSAAVRRVVAEIPLCHPQPVSAPRRLGWLSPAHAMRVALVAALLSAAAGAWLGSRADVVPEIAFQAEATASGDAWDELALIAFANDLDAELAP